MIPDPPGMEAVPWWAYLLIVSGLGFVAGVIWGARAFFKKYVIDSIPLTAHNAVVTRLEAENVRLHEEVRAWRGAYHLIDEATRTEDRNERQEHTAQLALAADLMQALSDAGFVRAAQQPPPRQVDHFASTTELILGDRRPNRTDGTGRDANDP